MRALRPTQVTRLVLGMLAIILAFGLLLFLPAGRLDWPAAWVYLLAYLLYLVVFAVWAQKNNPELLAERSRLASNTQGWDNGILAVYSILLLALFIVIGLDAGRFRNDEIPAWLKGAGWLGLILSATLIFWVLQINTYASRVARIQEDRGQSVVSSGPYRYVRHPMYAGIIVLFLCTPLALGSPWGLIPGGLIGILFCLRTALEDRMLGKELAGYEDYRKLVRYRLLPGIW